MKQPKTIKELIDIVGYNPFIWINHNNNERLSLFTLENNRVNEYNLLEGYLHDSDVITNQTINIQIVDWFEESNETKSDLCRCDFLSVILVTGCQCGGK